MAKKPTSHRVDEEILCGFHSVQSLLSDAPREVIEVLFEQDENKSPKSNQRVQKLQHDLEQAGINFRLTSKDELTQRAAGVKHQGVLARIHARPLRDPSELYPLLEQLDHPALLLILDCVQDPHNLGACLRTADGAGVDAVILPKHDACPLTPAVTRVASGAVARLPIFYVTNLARTLGELQKRDIWLIGGDHTAADTLYQMDFTPNTAIIMGAEGKGLRRLTRNHCDHLAQIPMHGNLASLNVSVATGLFLFEAVRQRSM